MMVASPAGRAVDYQPVEKDVCRSTGAGRTTFSAGGYARDASDSQTDIELRPGRRRDKTG